MEVDIETEAELNLEHEEHGIIDYIDELKVAMAINSFGPLKASGPDDIKPIVLQMLEIGMIKKLTQLYKLIIKSGYTPRKMREMTVIFLPKIGKSDYSEPKAYRPITLSSFLLKALERVIQWCILERYITKPLANQHAYTKSLSTETAISQVYDIIEEAVLNKQKCLAVSLDCSGAFDKIKFTSAVEAMEKFGIPAIIRNWYDRVLKNRIITANIQGVKKSIKPTKGSPQGGVLSPFIWNMIIDSLLSQFTTEEPVKAVGYADDVILLIKGFDNDTMANMMTTALERVNSWGVKHGLTFNPAKTIITMFESGTKVKNEPPVYMAGKELKYSNDMKYLGITLNKRLSFTNHLNEKMRKVGYLQNKINQIIGQEWGLTPARAHWVHTAIIRPKITYASIVWAHTLNETQIKKLESIQRRSLCHITQPIFKSTPTKGMEVLLGIPPLHLHAQELALNSRLRTRFLVKSSWTGLTATGKKGHIFALDRLLERLPEMHQPSDQIKPQLNWLEKQEPIDCDITAYTDGSKLEDVGTGCGWALTHEDQIIEEESIPLGENSTVFQAELIAIQAVLLMA
jgi:hypothetical protein